MTTGADWVDQARRLLDAFVQRPDAAQGGTGETGTHPDCTWCPLCQAAAVARGERPEVSAALADVLTATAAALRTFAESVQPPAAPPPAGPDDGPPPDPPPVQRIELS